MERPKLRKVERIEQHRGDERLLVVRDPLGVSEPFAVDAQYGVVLDLLDGSRSVAQIRQSLTMRGVMHLPHDDLADFVEELSEAGFLDDDRFRATWASVHAQFLERPTIASSLAGLLYPDDPLALGRILAATLPPRDDRFADDSDVRAVLVPHGPPSLVGDVLDVTLRELPPADSLDAIVVLGTDHAPGLLPYVTTDKAFETPLGSPPVAKELVQALDERLDWLRREEIRNRGSLSLELATLYVRWIFGDTCPPVLTILCGQTMLHGDDSARVDDFLGAMESVCAGRRVLWWASAELGHAGPAYGKPELDSAGTLALRARDQGCLDALIQGRSDALTRRVTEPHVQGRPSGGAVMTTLARLLPVGYQAQLAHYGTLNVDGPENGAVGVAGDRFRTPAPVG